MHRHFQIAKLELINFYILNMIKNKILKYCILLLLIMC